MKLKRNELRNWICSLLTQESISTQEELRLALKNQKGINVNQAMISRLLHQIKAVKISEGAQLVYRLSPSPIISSNDTLSDQILAIEANETLVVIITFPGSAPLVATVIDQHKVQLGAVGVIAADDTIFVAPLSIRGIKKLEKKIRDLLY